jgi:hypothetical protein
LSECLLEATPERIPDTLEHCVEALKRTQERLRAAEDLNHSLRDEVRELRDRLDAETVYLQRSILRSQGFDEISTTAAGERTGPSSP